MNSWGQNETPILRAKDGVLTIRIFPNEIGLLDDTLANRAMVKLLRFVLARKKRKTGLYAKAYVPAYLQRKWPFFKLGVAKFVLLHQMVLQYKSDGFTIIDHLNGNGLDNRKVNLRIVPASFNCANRHGLDSNNTSGIRGVYTDGSAWVASWYNIEKKLQRVRYTFKRGDALAEQAAKEEAVAKRNYETSLLEKYNPPKVL